MLKRHEGLVGLLLYVLYTLTMAVNRQMLESMEVIADCVLRLYLINTGRSPKNLVQPSTFPHQHCNETHAQNKHQENDSIENEDWPTNRYAFIVL